MLDATFSFDGVIGAFAISKDIIVIAVGLGLGALYIRTLTVYLVRQGTLAEYRYLEHGAHYAIGVLAVLLFISAEVHVPEVITGTIGALLILAAFFSSVRANRQEEEDQGGSGTPDARPAKVRTHDGHRLQQAAEEGRPGAGRGADLDDEGAATRRLDDKSSRRRSRRPRPARST